MLLLSEKFTPELTRDWEIELNRRDTLRREILQRNKNKEPINQILENLEEIKNRLKILEEKIDKRKMPAGTEMDGEKKHPETEKPKLRKVPGFSQQRFLDQKNQFFFKTEELRWKKTENYLRNSLKPLRLVMKFKLNQFFLCFFNKSKRATNNWKNILKF